MVALQDIAMHMCIHVMDGAEELINIIAGRLNTKALYSRQNSITNKQTHINCIKIKLLSHIN